MEKDRSYTYVNEIRTVYSEQLRKYRERITNSFKKDIMNFILTPNKLDCHVIRIKDGVEGVLSFENKMFGALPFLVFHPIKKDGSISQKTSGYISDYDNLTNIFKPKE